MFKLVIPAQELYDEGKNEFFDIKETTLQLEHSLVSLSRWESITHKPFLVDKPPKTDEEWVLYIQCMTVTQNVDPKIYDTISRKQIDEVLKYVDDPMSATWFKEDAKRGGNRIGETITSEYLYYMMVEMNVPMECQKWHLNRLMNLLRIISIKSKGNNKMSPKDMANNYAALKAARRKPRM